MSANKPDIQLIQKYLNGELDAKAMHALERQAQDDPFLMDAIDGYQETGSNQLANFAEVEERFAARVTEKERKRNIILLRVLPIAATLLIALTIGFLWLSPKEQKEQVAKNAVPKNQYSAEIILPKADSQIKQTAILQAPVNTNIVNNSPVVTVLPHHVNRNVRRVAHPNATPAIAGSNLADMLSNQVPNLNIQKNNPVVLPHDIKFQTINGVVTDPTGHALAGVKVAVKGTAQTAVTDKNGAFTLTTTDSLGTLNVAYAGYDRRQVGFGNGKDSLKVVLNESTNPLAAVVVAGHPDSEPMLGIHPLAGWKAFKDYIKKNAFMPDGSTGRVKLGFTINADGSLKGIRIIHGKSDAMNQKAIALLMNGPQWTGASDTKEFKLKIRFRKMKVT